MDFTGVFDFQLFWYKRLGWPQKEPTLYHTESADVMAEWLNALRDNNLNNRVCVDAGRVAAEVFDAVDNNKNGLVVHGSNDSDLEGMLRVRLMPKKLEIMLSPDPRMSYAALRPKNDVLEIDMGTWKKDKGQKCVLFYPHGSLLMTREHKTSALSILGIHYEQPGASSDDVSDMFDSGWKEAIIDRVKSRVLPRLKNHYVSVSLYGVEFGDVAPCEGGKGSGVGTTDAVFTFYVERTKGMKNKNLEYWAQEFFSKELPFYSRVWCKPTSKPRHSKLSVLVEMPE